MLWSVPLKPDFGMSIAAPAQQGGFCVRRRCAHQSVLLELADDAAKPKELWRWNREHVGIDVTWNSDR
ncbi:MAG: hypothetical protein U0992_04500 [Planctomycetaceae bacterium]